MGPSFRFLLRNGDATFPGVAVIFCGADAADIGGAELPAHVTGLLVRRVFAPSLDVAIREDSVARVVPIPRKTKRGTDPLVWRRIQVPEKYSFWDLHVAIPGAMGWRDYHLHEFRLLDAAERNVVSIGIPTDDDPDESPCRAWVAGAAIEVLRSEEALEEGV